MIQKWAPLIKDYVGYFTSHLSLENGTDLELDSSMLKRAGAYVFPCHTFQALFYTWILETQVVWVLSLFY